MKFSLWIPLLLCGAPLLCAAGLSDSKPAEPVAALEAIVLPWVVERSGQIDAEDFIEYYALLQADFAAALNTPPQAVSGSAFVASVHASLRDYADIEAVDYSARSQPIPAYKFWFFTEREEPFIAASTFRQRQSWLRSYYAN